MSEDYVRHLELSFLFYEAQRSGVLPKSNRIPWRGDSGLNHGADVGVDLTGGYYDAGDNVKFNFPQAFTMTILAWSGIDFREGYEMSGQMPYLKSTIRWGTDYLMKCHPEGSDKFFVQVGDGDIDHEYWKPAEKVDYPTPAFMIDSSHPGSEVSGETAAALAAASILFKNDDPKYSESLLKESLIWYNFAINNLGDYSISVPKVAKYYKSWTGYKDELAWASIWLYRAFGDANYLKTAKKYISDFDLETTGFDWDGKYQGVYVILAILERDQKYVKKVEKWAKRVINKGKYTPGGLYWNEDSEWGSLRRATAMAANLAFYAIALPIDDSLRSLILKFAKSQADYVQGKNPKKINYVVGADPSSPKSVHHCSASGSKSVDGKPRINAHIIYGALVGGPDRKDRYVDDRKDFVKNEVALDYNAGYTALLAYLIQEKLNIPDPKSDWIYDYRNQSKK